MYSPQELNRHAIESRRKFRVDYCNRLGSVRRNFALNVDSYQEACVMADGLFHDGMYSVCITQMKESRHG